MDAVLHSSAQLSPLSTKLRLCIIQTLDLFQASRSALYRKLSTLVSADRQIVHDILVGVYSYESRDDMSSTRSAFIMKTKQRLDRLWEAVPERMRNDIHPSPPPHIFSFL